RRTTRPTGSTWPAPLTTWAPTSGTPAGWRTPSSTGGGLSPWPSPWGPNFRTGLPSRPRLRLPVASLGPSLWPPARRARPSRARGSWGRRRRRAAASPRRPTHRAALAASHHTLAVLLETAGRPADGEQSCRQAVALREDLAAHQPGVSAYQRGLADSLNTLGN